MRSFHTQEKKNKAVFRARAAKVVLYHLMSVEKSKRRPKCICFSQAINEGPACDSRQ